MLGVGVTTCIGVGHNPGNASTTLVITSPAVFSVEENAALAFPINWNKPGGSVAITGGVDAAQLSISGATLSWANVAPYGTTRNYEDPQDSPGVRNEYIVDIRVTVGAETADQTITITVTDVDDVAPILTLPTDVANGMTDAVGTVTTDKAAGTLYWCCNTNATTPTADQIVNGLRADGQASTSYGNQPVGTVGVQTVAVSGLSAGLTYRIHFAQYDNYPNASNTVTGDGFTTDSGVDTTAPVLTLPTNLKTSDTAGTGTVTTNEANGTLYVVTSTSATQPSTTQIKAGQMHTGAAAAFATSQAVSAIGVQSVTMTGLAQSTAYYNHYLHRDAAGNDSNRSTAAVFTTDATPVILPVTAGSGWTTKTAQPAAVGDSTHDAYGYMSEAKWLVEQYRDIDSTLTVYIDAFHKPTAAQYAAGNWDGIDYVEVSVDNGSWVTATYSLVEGTTDVFAYAVTVNPASYTDGFHEMRARIVPLDGTPRVMQGKTYTKEWSDKRYPSLYFSTNGSSSLTRTIRYVNSTTGSDSNTGVDAAHPLLSIWKALDLINTAQSGDGGGGIIRCAAGNYSTFGASGRTVTTPCAQRYVTIEPDTGVADYAVVITGGSTGNGLDVGKLRLRNLTTSFTLSNVDARTGYLWMDNCRYDGGSTTNAVISTYKALADDRWDGGMYFRDCYFTNTYYGMINSTLVINCDLGAVGIDSFTNSQCVVNATIYEHLYPGAGGLHGDIFQLYRYLYIRDELLDLYNEDAAGRVDNKIKITKTTSLPAVGAVGDRCYIENKGTRQHYRSTGAAWVLQEQTYSGGAWSDPTYTSKPIEAICTMATYNGLAGLPGGLCTVFFSALAPTVSDIADNVGDIWYIPSGAGYRWDGASWVNLNTVIGGTNGLIYSNSKPEGAILHSVRTTGPSIKAQINFWQGGARNVAIINMSADNAINTATGGSWTLTSQGRGMYHVMFYNLNTPSGKTGSWGTFDAVAFMGTTVLPTAYGGWADTVLPTSGVTFLPTPTSFDFSRLSLSNAEQAYSTFTRSTTANYVDTATGLFKNAAVDVARFSYGGLLYEPQHINRITSTLTYSGTTGTIGTSSVPTPTIKSGAYSTKVTENSATSSHTASGSSYTTTATAQTFHFYVKAGAGANGSRVQITDSSAHAGSTKYVNYSLVDGSVLSDGGGFTSHGSLDMGGGFWWIWATHTATAGAGAGGQIVMINADNATQRPSYTGDGASYIYVQNWKYENGAVANMPAGPGGSATTSEADNLVLNWAKLGYADATVTVRYTLGSHVGAATTTQDVSTVIASGVATIPTNLNRKIIIRAQIVGATSYRTLESGAGRRLTEAGNIRQLEN